MIKYISHCRVPAPVSAGYFLFKHFVAYSKAQITYTQKHNTKDILQVIKGGYSANTYITPRKFFKHKTNTHGMMVYLNKNWDRKETVAI